MLRALVRCLRSREPDDFFKKEKIMKTRKIFWLSVVLFISVLSSRLMADDFTISGTVSDESGKPAAGAHVHFRTDILGHESATITDDKGRFTISLRSEAISPWQYVCAVSPDQKLLGFTHISLKEGIAKKPDISITLKPARIITGNVIDAESKPIEGVLVAGVINEIVYPNFAKTDKNGDFSFAYPNSDFIKLRGVIAFLENVGMDYVYMEDSEKIRGEVSSEKIKNNPFQLKLNNFESYKFRVTDE
jgi:hypothetical protein